MLGAAGEKVEIGGVGIKIKGMMGFWFEELEVFGRAACDELVGEGVL